MLVQVRAYRRRIVKELGKRGIRRLAAFLGRQSTIGDPPVFDSRRFAWAAGLEADWKRVRDEAEGILSRREDLPSFREISPDQARIARDRRWKTFFFYAVGYRDEDALAACPETRRLLETIPGLETAFLSVLPPRTHVARHRGITKGLVRGHLPLVVPGEPGACRMQVGIEMHGWREGRLLVFDDTVAHEVWNDSDEYRVVLLFDFRRPMRRPGALVSALFLRALRRTGYVRDGLRYHARWKEEWLRGSRP